VTDLFADAGNMVESDAEHEVPTIATIAPWFGNARSVSHAVGDALGDLDWCAVLFAGGMPELRCIRTKAGVASDLHGHIINLARVIADDKLLLKMIRKIDKILFHSAELAKAQAACVQSVFYGQPACADWAANYFVCAWMGRGGACGLDGEFRQKLSVRFNANGGSSAKRWRSAIDSLPAWHGILKKWEFVERDAFSILNQLGNPKKPSGIYADPPWVGAGDDYHYRFTDIQHIALAERLLDCANAGYRVVVRYGDCDFIRSLYRPEQWSITERDTRGQANNKVKELLIVNGGGA
jgi:site-specific DNA-adenine methylase